jgi:hypothetical protein
MALLYFLRTDEIRKAQLATGVGLVGEIMIRCMCNLAARLHVNAGGKKSAQLQIVEAVAFMLEPWHLLRHFGGLP